MKVNKLLPRWGDCDLARRCVDAHPGQVAGLCPSAVKEFKGQVGEKLVIGKSGIDLRLTQVGRLPLGWRSPSLDKAGTEKNKLADMGVVSRCAEGIACPGAMSLLVWTSSNF